MKKHSKKSPDAALLHHNTEEQLNQCTQAEEALRKSEERLRTAREAMLDSFLIFHAERDEQGEIIDFIFMDMNANAEKMLQLSSKQLIGKRMCEELPINRTNGFFEKYKHVVETGIPLEEEFYLPDTHVPAAWYYHQVVKCNDGIAISHRDISDRKNAEDKLRKNLAKFKVLIESFPIGITISDPAGNIIETNGKAAELLGLPREEHLKRKIKGKEWKIIRTDGSIFPADEYPSVRALNEKRIVENIEMGIVKSREEIIWLNVTAAPIPIEEYGVLIAYNDISRRRQMENALRENEERLRLALKATNDVVWDWDIVNDSQQWNEAGAKIFGWTEIVENTVNAAWWVERIHPDDRQRVSDSFFEAVNNRELEVWMDEYHFKKADGTYAYVMDCGYVLRDGQGKAIRMIGAMQDITERKILETELKESAERYKSLHNASFGGIAIHDKGMILECNQGLSDMTGYSPEELIGMDGLLLIAPEHREMVMNKIVTGYEKPYEANGLRKNGDVFPMRLEARNVPYKGKNVRTVEFRDITESKKAEKAIKDRENLLNKVFEILPIGLWFADANGKLIRGNPAGVKIWGAEPTVSMEEYGVFKARRYPSGEEIRPDDWALAHTIREGVTIEDEQLEIDAFDGQKKIILNYTAPVLDEQGNIQGAIVVNHDITRRKLAEQLIQHKSEEIAKQNETLSKINQELNAAKEKAEENENRFNLAMKASNDGLFDWDLETDEIYYSPGWKKMLGYEDHELPNDFSVWENLTDVEDVKRSWELQQKLIAKQVDRFVMEFKMKHKKGHWVDILSRAEAIFNEDGKAIRIIGTHSDITERKQAELALMAKIDELERFSRLTVGREITMVELKKEVNDLLNQLGKGDKYRIVE